VPSSPHSDVVVDDTAVADRNGVVVVDAQDGMVHVPLELKAHVLQGGVLTSCDADVGDVVEEGGGVGRYEVGEVASLAFFAQKFRLIVFFDYNTIHTHPIRDVRV